MKIKILIIDDEKDIRSLIKDTLEDENFEVLESGSSSEVFLLLNEKLPDAILLDIWLQGSELDGLAILEIIKKKYPLIPVIMISGHGNIETAVNSIKMGAYDYLEKPFSEEKLIITVKRAIQSYKLFKENLELKSKFSTEKTLIGESSKITKVNNIIDKVAPTSSRILIKGASGTGKKLAASIIHQKSKRSKGPFITYEGSANDNFVIEKELFGDNGSSNINSPPRKIGIFELANNGTLYIDSIHKFSIEIQQKLLKFLQTNQIQRIGSDKLINLDVRIISSTDKNLEEQVELGKFNKELFHRINVLEIEMPSLAQRRQDIPMLCDHFMAQLQNANKYGPKILAPNTKAILQAYNWPGNIRELKNTLEWLMIMSSKDSELILPSMLPAEISKNTSSNNSDDSEDYLLLPLKEAREIFETKYLKAQLNRHDGNISKMSRFIGMERSALHRKLKLMEILADETR